MKVNEGNVMAREDRSQLEAWSKQNYNAKTFNTMKNLRTLNAPDSLEMECHSRRELAWCARGDMRD